MENLPYELYKYIFIHKSYYSNKLTGKFLHKIAPRLYELPKNVIHNILDYLNVEHLINLILTSKKMKIKYINKTIDHKIYSEISRHFRKFELISVFINASANLNKIYIEDTEEYIYYKKIYINYIFILLNRYYYIYLLNDYLYIVLLKKMLCPFIINLLDKPPYYLFNNTKIKKKQILYKRYKHLYIDENISIDQINNELGLETELMIMEPNTTGSLYEDIIYKKDAFMNFYINYNLHNK